MFKGRSRSARREKATYSDVKDEEREKKKTKQSKVSIAHCSCSVDSFFLSFSRRDQLETMGIVQISLGNIESTINHNESFEKLDLCSTHHSTDYDRRKDEDDISRHHGSIIHSLSDSPA